MAISGDSKQTAYENGQHAFNSSKDDFFGPDSHEPWRNLFESSDDYEERLEAHHKGFDNARDNRWK